MLAQVAQVLFALALDYLSRLARITPLRLAAAAQEELVP